MTLGEYLHKMAARLADAGIEDADNEAHICLQTVTGMNSSALRFAMSQDISSSISAPILDELESVFSRREKHEPLAYIVGHAPFYDLEFQVGKGVLIPRFDTEILVEAALTALRVMQMPGLKPDTIPPVKTGWEDRPLVIYDLCAGTGCVGITIAHELQKHRIPFKLIMTEISPDAAQYTRSNAAQILGESEENGSWEVRLADLWPENLLAEVLTNPEKADIIVSNPPYVTAAEMEELAPEVKAHEPALALTDEGDGLSLYRRMADGLGEHLKPGGVVLFEHGDKQGKSVSEILAGVLFDIVTIQDYGGHDRVTAGRNSAE